MWVSLASAVTDELDNAIPAEQLHKFQLACGHLAYFVYVCGLRRKGGEVLGCPLAIYLMVPTVIGVPYSICRGVLNFGGGKGSACPPGRNPTYPLTGGVLTPGLVGLIDVAD